ncbi:uncharacterized protein [Antedon mediterranea]|uniref:uncharacterized protein n=1 Tax=Antedon mediterranea TaxID=105859 RepID=UPI003AF659EC
MAARMFKKLKSDLGRCYEGQNYLRLRCILFDHLEIGEITNPDSIGNDLFNALEDKGYIKPTNVDFLLEISKLSGVKGTENLVRRYMKDNNVQNTTDDPQLSQYRQRLFKVLLGVNPSAFKALVANYGLRQHNFGSVWDVVLKLEIDMDLEDDREKIETFADCLGKRARKTLGLSVDGNSENEGATSSQERKPSEDISKDDFLQLITDFAQWYDKKNLLDRLQVLFIEMVGEVEALKKVKGTSELLALLTMKGLLSQTDLTVLYDTIKITEQFGFESSITTKLPAFRDIKEREVSFSPHTLKIFNLGKSLSPSDINTLDGRYNFPDLAKYTDSWSLILDFEPKGFLKEEKLKEVNKVLKR